MRAVAPVPVPLWDLPTRLFHWLLVVLVAALWVSGEFDVLSLHLVLGPVVLTLLLFRLAWGVVGSSSARFAAFVRGPAAALAYLQALRRGESWPGLGHNPLGAYSVVALLGMLAVQGA
ncbi:MAG: cytochrome b/b6 domain-containing protein, partial [Magnetospirillum sp.]|nr:cytochrome b/b6 domain-containing protein [Magnetospirillum sp.]